jgi:hypothetical protein
MISQASHRSRIRVESLRGDLKSSLYLAFRSEYFIICLIPQVLEFGRRGAPLRLTSKPTAKRLCSAAARQPSLGARFAGVEFVDGAVLTARFAALI